MDAAAALQHSFIRTEPLPASDAELAKLVLASMHSPA
jgi:hypothetical protein